MSLKRSLSYWLSFSVGFSFFWVCRIASRLGQLIIHKLFALGKCKQSDALANKMTAGISVIIPERDNPVILRTCLESLVSAFEKIQEPVQVIVVVNGASAQVYQSFAQDFPFLEWIFVEKPLSFADAIRLGVDKSIYEWLFLLNNDMRLESDCLYELLIHRAPDVFSIASHIFFEDKTRRREETGLTGFRVDYDQMYLYDRDVTSAAVVEHLYSGGGASLFRKSLLKHYIKLSHSYDPFYWEDVDWGVRATLDGYRNIFVPAAKVWHLHRATVSRFYTQQQIDRIVEHNKWIFYLRFGLTGVHFFWLGRYLRDAKFVSWSEFADLLRACFKIGATGIHQLISPDYERFDIVPARPNLPWMVLVVPFAIYPKAHGAAIRQQNLYLELSKYFNIWLISDEGSSYDQFTWLSNSPFSRVSLVRSSRLDVGELRSERINSHARKPLRKLLQYAIKSVAPKIVQIEHEELCELVSSRQGNAHWAISLHDVNIGMGSDAKRADARLLKALSYYDAVFTCSPEDSKLLPITNHCIENGIDPNSFFYSGPSVGQRLVFVGPFRYKPNRDAIENFIVELWEPLRQRYPDIQLQILAGLDDSEQFVANNPIFQQSGVELVNSTLNVNKYLRDATLVINPLIGIRGSCLKTIEAIASGRICISTRDAARGLEHLKFPQVKIAEEGRAFLELIQFYIDNPSVRIHEEIPEAAKLQRFFWSLHAQQQLRVYQSL